CCREQDDSKQRAYQVDIMACAVWLAPTHEWKPAEPFSDMREHDDTEACGANELEPRRNRSRSDQPCDRKADERCNRQCQNDRLFEYCVHSRPFAFFLASIKSSSSDHPPLQCVVRNSEIGFTGFP